MKSIRSKSIDIEFIVDSICNCFRSKYNRNDICKFIAQYSDGLLDKETVKLYAHNNDNFQLFIIPCFYNMAKEYYDEIINHNITFEPIVTKERVDKSSNKVRLISTESIKQQIFDYICVDMMQDIFRRHLGTYQCASLPDRGQIYALRKRNYTKIKFMTIEFRKKNMKLHDAFVTTSYYGLLCHSDNYKFNKRFGYDKLEKSARKIISDSMSI